MSFNAVKNELLAIFPQHNEEAITRIYNTVVQDLGENTEVLVLPACIEALLTLPASKNVHDERGVNSFGGHQRGSYDKPQNKRHRNRLIFPRHDDSDSSDDDRSSSSSHDEAEEMVHKDYRNKQRPVYRERSASKSDDSLLGYLSDNDEILFPGKALDINLDNIEPIRLINDGSSTKTPIAIPDSPLCHKRKIHDKTNIKKCVNIIDIDEREFTMAPIVKKLDLKPDIDPVVTTPPAVSKEPEMSTMKKGMPGFSKMAMENIKAIIGDVDSTYLENLINVQEEVTMPITIQRIVDHLLNFKDYPKTVKSIPPPCVQKPASTFPSSSTITSCEETYKYTQQAIILLQNSFPKISTMAIRREFYRSRKYTTAYLELGKALTSVISGEKLVQDTILKSLLKGMRGKIKIKDLSSLLSDEVQQMEDNRKKDVEQGDLATASALNAKEYEQEGQAIECGCCYNEVAFEDMVQCGDGHLFCTACLQSYSREATYGTGKIKLSCMTDGCDNTFPLSQMKKALPEDLMNKYMERVQDEDIKLANLDNLIRCPGCDFAAEMDEGDKVFRCQNLSCMKESCRYCKEDWKHHFGVPCKELEKREATSLRTSYEEKMTQAKARKCWQCSTLFLKSDGCNKMTCRCGAKMCYICRLAKIDYQHFCNHPRNPGEGCSKCKKCSLWTDPSEDDDRAVAEIKKEAEKERMKLEEEQTTNISIGPQITIKPSTTNNKKNQNQNNHPQPPFVRAHHHVHNHARHARHNVPHPYVRNVRPFL